MNKKSILKSALGKGGCKGKGGPILDAGKKGFSKVYESNMAKYRRESGINKNMFPDSIKAGIKGGMYGLGKAGQEIGKNISEKKNYIKNIIKPIIREPSKKMTPENFPTMSKKNCDGEIVKPTSGDIKKFNRNINTFKPVRRM